MDERTLYRQTDRQIMIASLKNSIEAGILLVGNGDMMQTSILNMFQQNIKMSDVIPHSQGIEVRMSIQSK
jgi:hypothetical protein